MNKTDLINAIEGRVLALVDEPNSQQAMEIRRATKEVVNWLTSMLREMESVPMDLVNVEITRAVTSDRTARGMALLMPVLFMAGIAYAEEMRVE